MPTRSPGKSSKPNRKKAKGKATVIRCPYRMPAKNPRPISAKECWETQQILPAVCESHYCRWLGKVDKPKSPKKPAKPREGWRRLGPAWPDLPWEPATPEQKELAAKRKELAERAAAVRRVPARLGYSWPEEALSQLEAFTRHYLAAKREPKDASTGEEKRAALSAVREAATGLREKLESLDSDSRELMGFAPKIHLTPKKTAEAEVFPPAEWAHLIESGAVRALKRTVDDKPGPREGRRLNRYILKLQNLFERATGKKATIITTPYKELPYGGDFPDFVQACLNDLGENLSPSSIGQRIKRAQRKVRKAAE